jgi:predicted nucleic acid-binding protein
MTAEIRRQFVDTNVLIYAHDATAGDKQGRARQLLAELWAEGNGCLSIQVLQEFYVGVTRKVRYPLTPEVARQQVEDLGQWLAHSPTVKDVIVAIQLQQQSRLSFWDAMLITSAQKMNCDLLWSEDLNPGQIIGGVTIQNPFAPRSG